MIPKMPWKRENLSNIWTWPHIFLMNFGGWWAEEASTPRLRKFLSAWRVITICFTIINTFSLLTFTIKSLSTVDFSEVLVCIFLVSTLFQMNVNLFFMLKYRILLKQAMDLLDDLTRNAEHPEDLATIRTKLVRIWIIFLISFQVVLYGSLHWIIRPLIYVIFYGERTQILYDNWPLILNSRILWTFSYIFGALTSFLLSILFVLFNSLFLCIAEYILCHFLVLQNKFERLLLNTTHVDNKALSNLVKDYANILKVCENLRISSEVILISQTVVAIASYCLILFAITTDDDISLTVTVNLLEVFTSITLSFSLLCWYSDQITHKCEEFNDIAYMTNWFEGSQSQKRTLQILMTRTRLPIKFGGFIELTLNTLITVMKTTFSYYNFLIAVLEKQ